MFNKNLTDAEIKKALECCLSNDVSNLNCTHCPNLQPNCMMVLYKLALDLINRQNEEIERLGITVNSYKKMYEDIQHLDMKVDKIKAEAYKDFWEELKKRAYCKYCKTGQFVLVEDGNNLLKEMAGE